jgi:hypothetical protein
MEFLQDHWLTILLSFAGIGSFWLPGMRLIGVKIIKHMMTPKMLKLIFLNIAERLVKSTKTTFDNDVLDMIKKAFDKD